MSTTQDSADTILVIGATGLVGQAVCLALREKGKSVRALVRELPNDPRAATVKMLADRGVKIVTGDLLRGDSLAAACKGVRTVISTASAMPNLRPGDTLQDVDHEGQERLVTAARAAGVDHFVYVSFHPLRGDFALQRAKRHVEHVLRHSGLKFTILRPSFFMDVWLGMALGAIQAGERKIMMPGEGEAPISFISASDVARVAVAAVANPSAYDETFDLAGPHAVRPRHAVWEIEQVLKAQGKLKDGEKLEYVAGDPKQLHPMLDGAPAEVREAFVALQRNFAYGAVVSNHNVRATLGVSPHVSVKSYVEGALGAKPAPPAPDPTRKKAMPSNVEFGPDDIVIYADDGKFYVITKDQYLQSPLPDSLSGEAFMLVKNGTFVANMPNEPGVGCACYLLNVNSLRKASAATTTPAARGPGAVAQAPGSGTSKT
jgi:uncharacterized protein YbjT (DUF2867 family)